MITPFVGRQRELDELGALVQRSRRSPAPVAALVTGEPGSGKTRLLGEFLAPTRSLRPVRVFGFEPNQAVPLAAVGEVIRQLTTVPVHGPSLEALVFGGRDKASRAPLRIFEAAHRALSGYGPLLIGIDDLQWVDEQSIGLIQYLLRAADPTRQPLSLIAVSRPSPTGSRFRSTVESLLPPERRALIELGPMRQEDGMSLARTIDDTLDEAAAFALWQRARGSPFWLDALARSGGDMDPSRLIEERLRSLGRDPGAFLAMLAVGARPFLLDEVADLLEWDVARAGQASGELVTHGLGVEIGGTVRLSHDLIREAASASLPASARRRLHARIADWIEASAADDVKLLREALDHRIAAGQPSAELALRLVSSPGRRLLNAEDLRLLASISDGLEPGTAARPSIDRALGELGAVIGEVDLALGRWTRVSVQAADASERRDAETEAAQVAYHFGRRDAAHLHLERARALPPTGREAEVRLEALQADVELWLDHETAAGSRTADRAVAAAEEMAATGGGLERISHEARRAYLAALEVAIDGAMQENRDDDLVSLTERCLRVSASLDDEAHIAAQIRAGQALRTVRRPGEGEAQSRRAWDSSKRLVLPMLTVEAGRGLARVLRDMGRLAEALAIAVETRQLEARLTDAPRHWGSAASIRHLIALSFEDAAAALAALRRDAAEERDPHYRQDLHLEIATWRGRVAGAKAAREVEAELVAAQADAALARCPRHSAGLAVMTAELLARIGRVDDARRALDEWERRPALGSLGRELSQMRTAAAIAAASGDDVGAVLILEKLAHALERAGLNLDLVWAQIDLGRSLARVDRDRAVVVLTSAAGLAERCGAVSEGRLASQALRRLGVRAWRRGPAAIGKGIDSLSERERDVARRVAEGSNNREIALALAVSPKTVDRHVTNIFAKLGARNRTELAGMFLADSVRGSTDD